eukprot:3514227-Rhodomonas_salina.4
MGPRQTCVDVERNDAHVSLYNAFARLSQTHSVYSTISQAFRNLQTASIISRCTALSHTQSYTHPSALPLSLSTPPPAHVPLPRSKPYNSPQINTSFLPSTLPLPAVGKCGERTHENETGSSGRPHDGGATEGNTSEAHRAGIDKRKCRMSMSLRVRETPISMRGRSSDERGNF